MPRPRAPRAEKHKTPETAGARGERGRGKKGEHKKTKQKNKPKHGQPQPGGGRTKKKDKTAKGKVRRTKTSPGGRTARPVQNEHRQAHTRGTRAWRPPTRKGRRRRPHETAPMQRPSPPTKDGRYGKPDPLMTGSTHGKPPQRTQPKTEAGGTRQGQPHHRALSGYDAEQVQRPCIGRGQRQAQCAQFSAAFHVPCAAAQ